MPKQFFIFYLFIGPVRCRYCEKSFESEDGRKLHEKRHKKDKMKPDMQYSSKCCELCNNRFLDEISYDRHMQYHEKGEPSKKRLKGEKRSSRKEEEVNELKESISDLVEVILVGVLSLTRVKFRIA